MRSISAPFYLCTIAIFIGIVSPALFSEGMFMDGLVYATIARNLAEGIGSFWHLKFSETWFSSFHEHPPLAFGIQSIFFRIFGDNLLVERVYSLFTFFVTGYLIILIWKRVTERIYHVLAWLPLIFMVSIPLVTWAAANNMLENTMMVFTSLSVFCMFKSLDEKPFLYLAMAGVSIFLAFLSKGFTALFPLSFFLWVLVFRKDYRFLNFVKSSFVVLLFFLLPFILLHLVYTEAIESMQSYFEIQVANSIKNIVTVETRFFIVIRLMKELIPAFALIAIVLFIFRKKISKTRMITDSKIWILLALAFSGVLPIMISMKQSGFYMLATFPFFSIVLALLITPLILHWVNRINVNSKAFGIFNKVAILLVLASLIIASTQTNRIGRDKSMLGDIKEIIKIVPPQSTISMDKNLWDNWSLYGYFHRYAKISLDTRNEHNYLLVLKGADVTKGYKKAPLNLQKFDLYVAK